MFGGTRWHVRAFDEERADYVDLVLQRVLSAKPLSGKTTRPTVKDQEWQAMLTIEVVPKHSLTSTQAEVVAQEFGMKRKDGQWLWEVRMRECLAGYFIYLYRLDVKDDSIRRIELKDPSLAKKYLSAAL